MHTAPSGVHVLHFKRFSCHISLHSAKPIVPMSEVSAVETFLGGVKLHHCFDKIPWDLQWKESCNITATGDAGDLQYDHAGIELLQSATSKRNRANNYHHTLLQQPQFLRAIKQVSEHYNTKYSSGNYPRGSKLRLSSYQGSLYPCEAARVRLNIWLHCKSKPLSVAWNMLSAATMQYYCPPGQSPTAFPAKATTYTITSGRSAAMPYYTLGTEPLPSPTFLPTPPLPSPLLSYPAAARSLILKTTFDGFECCNNLVTHLVYLQRSALSPISSDINQD